ncbi:ankyrin [Westerdykella ornata]|uniref:Ankyrin n=1 Tax=Westerdykella ornata TaxID=318751 RepID=A0A6A6J6P6_WESOR|nr:ankyrin [Westerdykella ornata]KAF2271306.1 ankyrin [Westerdykella ornata]
MEVDACTGTEHSRRSADLPIAGPSDLESPPPPLYTSQPQDPVVELKILRESLRKAAADLPLPLLTYPPSNPDSSSTNREINLQQEIITSFFLALSNKNIPLTSAFLSSGLVSAESTDNHGCTPLLAAISTENVAVVKLLLDAGANVNRFSPKKKKLLHEKYPPLRTPLMHACTLGSLPVARILLSEYAADDALVAPDGETALHLAAKRRHREIVAFLPMRRAGGWKRWKCRVDRTVGRRVRKLGRWIVALGRVLLWEIPKLLLWDCPKHVILPGLKKIWSKRKDLPRLTMKLLKGVWKGLKEVPEALWEAMKLVPNAVKWLTKLIWNAIKSLPGAVKIALVWAWSGVKAAGISTLEILKRLGSFLHTVLSAVASFFRGITLQDIWNGFVDVLEAVFIKLPAKLWDWIATFGKTTYEIIGKLFGCTGKAIWYLLLWIFYLLTYVPLKLVKILVDCGKSVGNGFQEILLWINPKRTTWV